MGIAIRNTMIWFGSRLRWLKELQVYYFPPFGTTLSAVDFSPSEASQISTNKAASAVIKSVFISQQTDVDRFHDSPRQLKDVNFLHFNLTALKLGGVCDIFPPRSLLLLLLLLLSDRGWGVVSSGQMFYVWGNCAELQDKRHEVLFWLCSTKTRRKEKEWTFWTRLLLSAPHSDH